MSYRDSGAPDYNPTDVLKKMLNMTSDLLSHQQQTPAAQRSLTIAELEHLLDIEHMLDLLSGTVEERQKAMKDHGTSEN
jgi:hypothetical protein